MLLTIAFAESGFSVVGSDKQSERVRSVNHGKSYITDVTSESLLALVKSGQLMATSSYDNIKDADAICIPTPLTKTKEPDLSYVVNVAENLSSILEG